MTGLDINIELLRRFEKELDPRFPEECSVPTKVLGYGEISTVLELGEEGERRLAYKRLPMFKTVEEAENYQALHEEYVQILRERIGLQVVSNQTIRFVDEEKGSVLVYIVQNKLPSGAIGHKLIHTISPDDTKRLIYAVLERTKKVFDFNQKHGGELEIGFDGQISNWALEGFDPEAQELGKELQLVYFDTSTPLIQKNGLEQLNPELFLRSAPSFLVWFIRWLFLEDVMTRYYDFRNVALDIIANFYKEQLSELIPYLIDVVNEFFSFEIGEGRFEPITEDEVRAYYREDSMIWRIYLTSRVIDRFFHRLLKRDYPYILPEKIIR